MLELFIVLFIMFIFMMFNYFIHSYHTTYNTADCSELASVGNQQAVTTVHSSKKILLNSFVPNLAVETFCMLSVSLRWQVCYNQL